MAGVKGQLLPGTPQRISRDSRIAVLSGAGLNQQEIADRIGIDRSRVGQILRDEEIKALVDKTARETIALLPKAKSVIADLLDDDQGILRFKAADRVLQIAGISPSHASSTVIQNIYNDNRGQDNRVLIDAGRGVIANNLSVNEESIE